MSDRKRRQAKGCADVGLEIANEGPVRVLTSGAFLTFEWPYTCGHPGVSQGQRVSRAKFLAQAQLLATGPCSHCRAAAVDAAAALEEGTRLLARYSAIARAIGVPAKKATALIGRRIRELRAEEITVK